jgi:flagellar hook-associated protein 2
MAGLSSPGIGSGLDINGLVAKLVAAERAPAQNQITRQQTSTVTTISALGALKGALGGFEDALDPLSTLDSFSSKSATSSDPDIFSATATSDAAPGSYDIEVIDVAQAHQISSGGVVGGANAHVGTGTLTIRVGEGNIQIAVPQSANTLAGIRDAINTEPGNTIVRATIVNANDGAHLVLTSQLSGAANKIQVEAAGGDGGLTQFAYNPGLTTNYRELRPAADSIVNIGGYLHNSTSRTIDGAIDGVSITLLDKDAGETKTLTIANDTSAITSRISAFVKQFNSLASTMGQLGSYEPSTKKAGPLLGDSLLRTIESDVRTKLTDRVAGLTGNYQSLASIGITTNSDGTLKLDNAKLTSALNNDYDGVAKIFASDNGIAARMKAAIAPRLAVDSELDVRQKRLNHQSIDLQKQVTDLDTKMSDVQARLLKQFNALDALLAQMQSTSNYLTQQLSSISQISKPSSGS